MWLYIINQNWSKMVHQRRHVVKTPICTQGHGRCMILPGIWKTVTATQTIVNRFHYIWNKRVHSERTTMRKWSIPVELSACSHSICSYLYIRVVVWPASPSDRHIPKEANTLEVSLDRLHVVNPTISINKKSYLVIMRSDRVTSADREHTWHVIIPIISDIIFQTSCSGQTKKFTLISCENIHVIIIIAI
jgi:hypothetical protein